MAGSARRAGALGTLMLATALVAAACDSPMIPVETAAYDPTLTVLDTNNTFVDLIYHWPVGKTIRIFVDTTAQPAGADLRSAVTGGIGKWAGTLYFRETGAALTGSTLTADVIFHFSTAPMLVGTGACGAAATPAGGVTYFCASQNFDSVETLPRLALDGVEGHVKIDVTIDRSRAADDAQFRALVAHELGHVFGIGKHSPTRTDLMFGAPTAAGPTDRDAATLRFALHQPVDLRL